MINPNRIVPSQVIDLISLYGLILLQNDDNSGLAALPETNPEQFNVTTSSGSVLLAAAPVQSLNIASGVSAVTVYFVPSYNYEGFTVNGAAATIANNNVVVNPDGRTLYKAVLSSGTITITQEGF